MYFWCVLINFVGKFGEIAATSVQGPPESTEIFMFNGVNFAFYSYRAARDEANSVCKSSEMHLAVLDTSEKAEWAAKSMGTSWVIFENMWIGGVRNKDRWYWTHVNKTLPEKPIMEGNYPFMYPPWADFVTPLKINKRCLAIDTNGEDEPIFVDLSCSEQRPFICEDDNVKDKKPWPVSTSEYRNIRYVLYHGHLSWLSSVSYCLEQGFSLATVVDLKMTQKLGKMMLKSRPPIEDAWIGAHEKDGEWVWIETGSPIQNTSDGFPPWMRPPGKRPKANCAVITASSVGTAHFVNIQCDKPRSFVCSKKIPKKTTDDPIIYNRLNKRYFFYSLRATWWEANKFCESQGPDITMLTLGDADETKFIVETMADVKHPMDHLWLGGRVIGGVWRWHPSEKPEENISVVADASGFPPWCDLTTSEHLSCLNLDRQNKWTPLMYGLECNATQSFVCVQTINEP